MERFPPSRCPENDPDRTALVSIGSGNATEPIFSLDVTMIQNISSVNGSIGSAMSVAVFSLWVACFLLTETFPLLIDHLGPAATFGIYAAICVAGFLFILLRLPETKGKTLEEIEALLVGRKRSSSE